MSGETDLDKLIALMQPRLLEDEYVFCTMNSTADTADLNPLATYQEEEGLSLLIEKSRADQYSIPYTSSFRGITLSVHSSLDAVGFTAAVSRKLASHGISANVIAAHYHDHVFVPADRAEQAISLLTELEK